MENFRVGGLMFAYVTHGANDQKSHVDIQIDKNHSKAFRTHGGEQFQKVYMYKFEGLLPLIRKYQALMYLDKIRFRTMILNPENSRIAHPA